MPRRDPDFSERERTVVGPKPDRVAFMTEEQIAEWNAKAPPSQRILFREFCGAATKTAHRTGKAATSTTCTFMSGYGTDHVGFGPCKWHGGTSPSGKKIAARELATLILNRRQQELSDYLAQERYSTIVPRFGGDRNLVEDLNPEEALLEEIKRSVAMVRWLEEQIGLWPTEFSTDGLGGLPNLVAETTKGVPGATDHQVWMMVYREERMHMAKVSKMAIDGGVAQAQVRIAEQQGALISKGLRVILGALGLSAIQAERAQQVIPLVLRAMDSGTLEALPQDLVAQPSSPSDTDIVPSSATVL